jgi:arsenite methyltransferase
MSEVSEAVRTRYAAAAKAIGEGGREACCAPTYSQQQLIEVGLDPSVSLGCGNPTLLAELAPGEVVLDLGSGAGLDVLLSARRVAPGGHAFGVDMTDEMLELAERNRARAGVENATFLKGAIEAVPLPDASVDVVLSNCVINLATDKGAVLREAFRVLRPGGRLAVADMVEVEPLAAAVKQRLEAWAGCIAGTIPADEYVALLRDAGFDGASVDVYDTQALPDAAGRIGSAYVRARKPA